MRNDLAVKGRSTATFLHHPPPQTLHLFPVMYLAVVLSSAAAWQVLRAFVSIVAPLAVWRLWSFTVKPALYPRHPKEIPYWIPWLGHALAFVADGQNLVRRGRLYFNNTREPFFITLGGQRLYILTAPDDVALAYKDTDAFTFDKAVADLTHQFGVSEKSCVAFYERPGSKDEDPACKAGFPNPSLKSIAHLNSDFLKLQLHPGIQVNELAAKFTNLIHEWTSEEHLSGDLVLSAASDGTEKTVSLYIWAREDVQDAKGRVIDAIERYIAIPREKRPDMAPVIDYYERVKRAKGIPDREIATVIAMLYFVTNTNTFKLSFWIMAHLLNNPEYLEQIKSEIKPAFDPVAQKVDFQYLLDKCPFFNAAFDETLRLCSATASIRTTTKPVEVHGKMIPANSQIMCPFRELHWNTDVWGQDPSVWDPRRFIKTRNLNRNSSYRPFGGGLSYCPGRMIARTEALLFISLVLERFDITLNEGQKFPRYDGKPNPGLMAPRSGDDLIVTVKAKDTKV
nr:cytochrome p450 18a1 [Quercus suber]